MIVALIEFLRRRLKTVILLCCVVLALLVIGDWLLVGQGSTPTPPPEHWFGFWSVFGFLSCLAIIFFSKWYGHLGIMKQEDYYDDD